MEKLIDKVATHNAVRLKYGSVAEFCRQHKCSPHVLYAAVRGDRGTDKGRPAIESGRVLDALRDNDLLIKVKAG